MMEDHPSNPQVAGRILQFASKMGTVRRINAYGNLSVSVKSHHSSSIPTMSSAKLNTDTFDDFITIATHIELTLTYTRHFEKISGSIC